MYLHLKEVQHSHSVLTNYFSSQKPHNHWPKQIWLLHLYFGRCRKMKPTKLDTRTRWQLIPESVSGGWVSASVSHKYAHCLKFPFFKVTLRWQHTWVTFHCTLPFSCKWCHQLSPTVLTATVLTARWDESQLVEQRVLWYPGGCGPTEEGVVLIRVVFAETGGQTHFGVTFSQTVEGRLVFCPWKTQKHPHQSREASATVDTAFNSEEAKKKLWSDTLIQKYNKRQ